MLAVETRVLESGLNRFLGYPEIRTDAQQASPRFVKGASNEPVKK
jgi:hypothetical protein